MGNRVHSVASEYLEAIYTLHAEGEDAFAVTLADLFAVSRANASATVGRLMRDGLVEIQGRQILLTEAGTARAESAILRHRLTECFLMDVLGMDWAVVHEQARSFERGITTFLEERIDRQIGMPRTCPHGNPIPRPDLHAASYLRDRGAMRLSTFLPGLPATVLTISELVEGRPGALCFCAEQGLRPGARIDRVEQEDGGTAAMIDGRRVLVEATLANHIWAVHSDERGS